MGLLPVALGLPRTIRFPVLVAHQPSPYSDRLEDTQSKKSDHSLLSQPRQPPDNKLVKCFFMDRLLEALWASWSSGYHTHGLPPVMLRLHRQSRRGLCP